MSDVYMRFTPEFIERIYKGEHKTKDRVVGNGFHISQVSGNTVKVTILDGLVPVIEFIAPNCNLAVDTLTVTSKDLQITAPIKVSQ